MKKVYKTNRTTIPEAEKILGKEIPVLDHGFIRLVDYMGGDESIVQAARTSYGKGTKSLTEDRGLIRYLMQNKHTTPFEMVEMKWHCKVPIFVMRQWIRHRTANVNEYSMRYSEATDKFYIPASGQLRKQSKSNRQGSSDERVAKDVEEKVLSILNSAVLNSKRAYHDILNSGISRELARICLPLNAYTEFYWKNDLHNTLHFLNLRLSPHAQEEIRVYAQAMAGIIKKIVPMTYEAFEDYTLNAISLSLKEKKALRGIIAGKKPEKVIPQLIKSKREKKLFEKKLEDLTI